MATLTLYAIAVHGGRDVFHYLFVVRGPPRRPRRAQESPGEPGRAQESPGEPRRTQESPGEPRRAQESPGQPRESPGRAQGEPRRAQGFLSFYRLKVTNYDPQSSDSGGPKRSQTLRI